MSMTKEEALLWLSSEAISLASCRQKLGGLPEITAEAAFDKSKEALSVLTGEPQQTDDMIPRPRIEVVERDSGYDTLTSYDVIINGEVFAWYSSDSWGTREAARQAALTKRGRYVKALGMGDPTTEEKEAP